MSEKLETEQFLDAMRIARMAGDIDATTDLFDEDAVFSVVGVGGDARGKAAIRAALSTLIAEYEFLDWSPIKVVVAGNDIAARHHHLKLKHGPSGKVVETQTSEFISVKDGRCRSFTQYVDTALIAALNAT